MKVPQFIGAFFLMFSIKFIYLRKRILYNTMLIYLLSQTRRRIYHQQDSLKYETDTITLSNLSRGRLS